MRENANVVHDIMWPTPVENHAAGKAKEGIKDGLKEGASKAQEDMKAYGEKAKEGLKEGATKAQEDMKAYGEKAKQGIKEGAEKATKAVKEKWDELMAKEGKNSSAKASGMKVGKNKTKEEEDCDDGSDCFQVSQKSLQYFFNIYCMFFLSFFSFFSTFWCVLSV